MTEPRKSGTYIIRTIISLIPLVLDIITHNVRFISIVAYLSFHRYRSITVNSSNEGKQSPQIFDKFQTDGRCLSSGHASLRTLTPVSVILLQPSRSMLLSRGQPCATAETPASVILLQALRLMLLSRGQPCATADTPASVILMQ